MSQTGYNIYKRKDGRWEGRYPIERKENGKIKYGYIYGTTFQEVKIKIVPIREKMQYILHKQRTVQLTYQNFAQNWLQNNHKAIKLSTFSSYQYKLKRYLYPYLGHLLLEEVTPVIIQELVHLLTNENLGPGSIHTIMALLNRTLKVAVQQNLIYKNPCISVILPKKNRNKVHSLSKEEQKRLEDVSLKSNNQKDLAALLALHTGMRIGEIAALKWGNIYFDRNILSVENTYQRLPLTTIGKTTLSYDSVKSTASQRVIPLTNKIKLVLKQLQSKATGEYVFSNCNKPCEPRLLTYHFHRLRKCAKLNHIHFHQLRHTFATRCLESGADIPSVSALLGHSSTQMTLDIYSDSLLSQRIITIQLMEHDLY